jgi:hypothetical protein
VNRPTFKPTQGKKSSKKGGKKGKKKSKKGSKKNKGKKGKGGKGGKGGMGGKKHKKDNKSGYFYRRDLADSTHPRRILTASQQQDEYPGEMSLKIRS